MPKIEEFNPGALGLRPSEVGVEATAGAARRIGAFFNQAAEAKQQTGRNIGSGIASAGEAAVAIEDHREISTGAAHGVQTLYNLEQSKDKAIAEIDPNDPAYGPKVEARLKQWRDEQVEPALEQFSQGFNTQKSQAWAESFVDKTRTSLFHSSISDVANAQKTGFQNSTRATINTATNLVTQKPELLDDQLDLLRHSLSGSGSALKGVAGAAMMNDTIEKASEQMVKGATLGAILKSDDPEATAADFVRRYPKYIKGDEALQLGRAAAVQSRSLKRDEKAMMDWNHTEMTRDATLKLGKVFSDNVSYDETGKPIIKPGFFTDLNKVVAGNDLAADHARTLAEWGSKHLEDKAAKTSDPVVKQGLLDRFTSNNPPTDADILRAEANGKLSTQDGRVIRDLRKDIMQKPLTDPIYKATMDGVKGVLGTDPIGHEKYASFFQTFVPAYLSLPPDQQAKALDINDPNSLLSKTMAPLKRTPIQMILDKKAYGLIDPATAATALATGETIGGVKPTSIRTGGQVVLPPPEKRTIDQTYETPNGPRIWKGNGWARPGAQ